MTLSTSSNLNYGWGAPYSSMSFNVIGMGFIEYTSIMNISSVIYGR